MNAAQSRLLPPNPARFQQAANALLLAKGILPMEGSDTLITKPFGCWVALLAEFGAEVTWLRHAVVPPAERLLSAADDAYQEACRLAEALNGIVGLLYTCSAPEASQAIELISLVSARLSKVADDLGEECASCAAIAYREEGGGDGP